MGRRALIVDDNRALAEDLGEILELEGYEVAVFDDPARALRETEEQAFDVALLDVRMPGLDGVLLHRRLLARHPHTVFILMTAYTEDDRIASALAAGVRQVLMKPVPLPKLMRALQQACGEHRDILLVDDDMALNDSLSELLTQSGYRVRQAYTLAEARRLASEGGWLAAIVDIRLPDGDGADLAAELARTSSLAVILVTGFDLDEHDTPLIKQLGSQVHLLVKPFPPDSLLRALPALPASAGERA